MNGEVESPLVYELTTTLFISFVDMLLMLSICMPILDVINNPKYFCTRTLFLATDHAPNASPPELKCL